MYHVMGGGNMDTWHDHIYVDYTLVATQLLPQWHIYNNFKIVVTCNYNAIPKKFKHG